MQRRGIILFFIIGFVVFIISLFSVVKIVINRLTTPANDMKDEIVNLKERIEKFENEQRNDKE